MEESDRGFDLTLTFEYSGGTSGVSGSILLGGQTLILRCRIGSGNLYYYICNLNRTKLTRSFLSIQVNSSLLPSHATTCATLSL